MANKQKIFMGSWCFTFGMAHPPSLDTVLHVLEGFGYDGIALGAKFTGHAAPDQFPDTASRKKLVEKVKSHGLEIAGYAPDPYCFPWATDPDASKQYERYFGECLKMAHEIGSPGMRVDPGSFGPLPRETDYNAVWDHVVTTFQKQAKMAADIGITLLWEPETGQIFVKPSEIVKLVNDVGSDHFKINYDFGHAQAISVLAHNQVQPFEKLENGQFDYIKMLKGKIGDVGINDNDNNTYENLFGTHLGIGRGVLEVEKIFNAIVDSGFEGPWWACDAIPMGPVVWEDAYTGVFRIREMLDKRFG
ncbi:MAG: sugar phosphate isomerase/epimerase [Treponema sp.]|jgi:sugar phosphate isomerase/epimerase|nr:sugar phosphate isomerase/epimerase [Treponema sp.]